MSPFFLYRGLIIPIVQSDGMIPESRITLKNLTMIDISSFGQCFMNSFSMLSIPGDLLFFKDLMCLLISSNVNATFIVSFKP